MFSLTPIQNLFDRLSSYPMWEVLLEIAVIWFLVYLVVRFVQGSRAAGALKGILVLFLVATLFARVLSGSDVFQRLSFLYDKLLALAAIGLVVVFQPELRRALIRLGEAPFFRSTPTDIVQSVNAIVKASAYLSKARFGAIIAIERNIGLEHLVQGGTPIRGEATAQLFQTIFYPGTALHDLAVIVRGKVVRAAGVQLPLADPADMKDPALGSRHRAAVGLTKECDALVVVVSEETGLIRIAERGTLSAGLSAEELRSSLLEKLQRTSQAEEEENAETQAHQATDRGVAQGVDDPGQATAEGS